MQCGHYFNSGVYFKANMTEALHSVKRDVFQSCFWGFYAHLQRCVRVNGNYYEGSLYNIQALPQNHKISHL